MVGTWWAVQWAVGQRSEDSDVTSVTNCALRMQLRDYSHCCDYFYGAKSRLTCLLVIVLIVYILT